MLAPGLSIQLLVADIEGGFLVANTRFAPGTQLPTHLHTGAVHGFTTKGSWYYREYGEASMNTPVRTSTSRPDRPTRCSPAPPR